MWITRPSCPNMKVVGGKFVQAYRLSAYVLKYKTWGGNHNATLRTLGVRCSLLAVEEIQGMHAPVVPVYKEDNDHNDGLL